MCFEVDDVGFLLLGAQVDQQVAIGHAEGVEEVIDDKLPE